MTANYTLGHPRFADREPQVRIHAERLQRAGRMLQTLLAEDIAAYQRFREATRRSKQTGRTDDELSDSAELATMVPAEVVGLAGAVLESIAALRELANPNLLADLVGAAILAHASARLAARNITANLPAIRQTQRREQISSQVSAAMHRIEKLSRQITEQPDR